MSTDTQNRAYGLKSNALAPSFSSREAAIALGCMTAYVFAFFLACQGSVAAVWWMTAAPAITAGWTWGMRRGFAVGVAMSPLNAILFTCVGLPGWALISAMPGVWAQAIAPLAGAIFGRLHELNVAIQKVRDERREQERELQLTRRSLDATLELLSERSMQAHLSQEAQNRAEADSRRSQQDLDRAKVRLTHTSLTDVRTDLPNRRAALEFLNKEWVAARQRNKPLSCIVVEVDELQPIRALHGLEAADQTVRETAEILRDSIRETDQLFSLGDEEFLIVGPNVDLTNAFDCAERLRALVSVNTVIVGDQAHHVTVSAGVASNEQNLCGADELLRAAQQALYSAQQDGRNRVACYETERKSDNSYARELSAAM